MEKGTPAHKPPFWGYQEKAVGKVMAAIFFFITYDFLLIRWGKGRFTVMTM